MKVDYLGDIIPNIVEKCEKFKERILVGAFSSKDKGEIDTVIPEDYLFCFTPVYLRKYEPIKIVAEICDMLGISYLENNKDYLMRFIHRLEEPDAIKRREDFVHNMDRVIGIFTHASTELKQITSYLSEEERDRLNEAIHNLMEGCYYSSIAMSVCSIESRLVELMKRVTPDKKLEEETLGRLIDMCLGDQKYKSLIPEKHEPLLKLCNQYRIFSVHPKREKMTKANAVTILNLTFSFLTDKTLKRVDTE
ncbi:MAG: hypothetical protein H3Z52_13695 [archaeon]|nr:hypothetical protein [archaeon]MCP8321967.1 hypothetical protein [archaeon]